MTLPVILPRKITLPKAITFPVTMRKSFRFPTGGSLTRPYRKNLRKHRGRQIPIAGIGQEDHDGLALVFRPLRLLDGGM